MMLHGLRRPLLLLPLALTAASVSGCTVRLPSAAYDAVSRAASRPRPAPEPEPSGSRTASVPPSSQPRSDPARSSAPPAAPAFYPLGAALAHASSSPLEVVGVGEWPGQFRRLACVYRNARVLLVDERCSDPREPEGIVVHVLSPERGRVTFFAEAAGPIGKATRADYKALGVGSAEPHAPPKALSPSMTYEEIAAYEADVPGKPRASCTAGTQRPQGFCTKNAPMTAAEYAASAERFLRDPPPDWFDLVRQLVRLRAAAHAAIRPASLPLPRLAAWGASWGRDQEITVSEAAMKRVGNPHGRSAAIAVTADGGALVAGTTTFKGQSVPGVVRADAGSRRVWFKALPEKGFTTHEEASVAALPDGALVLSPGYDDPGWKPKARVVRLDDRGNVRWQWIGRGKNRHQIPQVVTAQPTPKGTFLLRGYVQLVADGDVHAWEGELDAKGKAIRDDVGPVLPDHGASFE